MDGVASAGVAQDGEVADVVTHSESMVHGSNTAVQRAGSADVEPEPEPEQGQEELLDITPTPEAPTLALANYASTPDRAPQPSQGIDAALDDAFNTGGRSNSRSSSSVPDQKRDGFFTNYCAQLKDKIPSTINLKGMQIDHAKAARLADVIKVNATLTYLDLTNNQIGDAGAGSLADAIKLNTTLTAVHLDGNQIGDAGAVKLANVINTNTSLTSVHLSANEISSVGATSLANAIKVNATLTSLMLGSNRIDDVGAGSLADAIKLNATLTALWLDNNQIG